MSTASLLDPPHSKLLSRRFWRSFLPLPPVNCFNLGERAPDFTLPEITAGQSCRLSQYWGEKPVVLAFLRIFTERHYCPICFPHLVALNNAAEKFEAAGAQLIFVTSTPVAQSRVIQADLQLQAPLLCDPSGQTFSRYGTGQALGAPLAAQFVLDRYGRLQFWHRFSFLAPAAQPSQLLYTLATQSIDGG